MQRDRALRRPLLVCLVFGVSIAGCASGKAVNRLVGEPGYGFKYIPEGMPWDRPGLFYDHASNVKKLDDAGFARCHPDLLAANPYWLTLNDAPLTDASVPLILKLVEVQSLDISGTRISKDGFKALAKLPKVHSINSTPGLISESEIEAMGWKPDTRLPTVEMSIDPKTSRVLGG